MDETAHLVAFNNEGETIRERQVAVWYVTDVDEDEGGRGVYICLSSSADLRDTISDVGLGLTLSAETLRKLGFVYLPNIAETWAPEPEAQSEDTEAPLEYVKVF